MPPATGSIKIYSVEYVTAAMVPRFGGRLGTTKNCGMGKAGELVAYANK
jgi:hypothetical protein